MTAATDVPTRGHRSVVTMLPELDLALSDQLYLALYDAGATDIRTTHRPRRGDHGQHDVTWKAHGRTHEARGYTEALALRRALTTTLAASPRPSDPGAP